MFKIELVETKGLTNILLDYLTKERSFQGIETWLVEHLQEILDAPDKNAIELANKVDAMLIEVGEGLLTEEEFRASLSKLIQENHHLSQWEFTSSHTDVRIEERDFSPAVVIHVNDSFARAEANI